MSDDARFQQSPGVVWQRIDDGLMLLDVGLGQYFELNHSGARMFELLVQGHTLTQVRAQMLAEFAIDAGQLAIDLGELVATLSQNGLISPGRPAESPG